MKGLKIMKQSILTALPLISLFFLFESVYTPNGSNTGSYNHIVLPSIVILLLTGVLAKYKGLPRTGLILTSITLFLLVTHNFLMGGVPKEFIRYLFTITLFYLAFHVPLPNMKNVSRLVIVVGLAFAILEADTTGRATGFLNTSPTLFSFVILICSILILYGNKTKLDYLLIFASLYLMFESETRSTLAILSILIFYKVLTKIKKRVMKVFFVSAIALLSFVIINVSSPTEFNVFDRTNSGDSITTRLNLISSALAIMTENPISFVIGEGPGMGYQTYFMKVGVYVPFHFDVVTILFDFGVIGVFFMLFYPIRLLKLNIFVFSFFLLGAFHNLLFFPTGLILLIFSVRYLNELRRQKSSFLLFRHYNFRKELPHFS